MMQPRHLALLAALALAAGLVVFGDSTPSGGVAEPAERAAPRLAGAAPAAATPGPAEPAIARLIPRAELVGDEDDIKGADAVFGSQNWNPPPPKLSAAAAAAALPPPPPPPPPSAPPLPFTYLGKALEAGTWEIYLARGDKTYIVKIHAVIDGQYRVDAIAPPMLTLTYLPLNQVQTLNIGVLN